MSATWDEAESRALPAPRTRVGRFSFDTGAGVWEWDDEVYRILGLQPRSITPATEYMVSSKDPEDRARVADILVRARSAGKPTSVSYCLAAADGVERRVLIVCEAAACAESASGPAINGHYIDLTADFRRDSEKVARQAVMDSAQHRATIERAIGALMVGYSLNADQAFDTLRWWSQNKNVKLRELAGRLIEAASTGATSDVRTRKSFDVLLHDVSMHRPPRGGDALPGS
ncbi:ANTAR domain-containing protein [Nocardioides sp. LHG3406-4]|uniref:ANTAR domain-containing protein n=1 Tax=Nocardioides sp. LHG3406-4 TaxID=2804575 RepID=UPI003CE7CA30